MTQLHNIKSKAWFKSGRTMRLSELEAALDRIRLAAPNNIDPYIVAVFGQYPIEAGVGSAISRSEALNNLMGVQLNSLSGDVTDTLLEDVETEIAHELKQGEVVYLVLNEAMDSGEKSLVEP